MIVATLKCECIIYDAHSLKEKRAVLKRIVMREFENDLMYLVAEIDYQDLWQRTKIRNCNSSLIERNQRNRNCKMRLTLIDSFPEIERTITTILMWL